jgi:hypothetical protein
LDLLGRNGEDSEYLSHDLHKYFRHFGGQLNLSINSETLEEALDALKQFGERIVARSHIFCHLYNVGVRRGSQTAVAIIRTERSTPMPVKTAPAGGNAYTITLGYTLND